MPSVDPKLVIRLGSHAEKDYLIKTTKFIDGLMVAGNLIESTPGATGSLLIRFGGKKANKPFYIDPITYGFSCDLDLLKSEQKKARGSKEVVWDFKKSYRKLAEQYGGLFANVIASDTAIGVKDFASDAAIQAVASSVANYQLNRVRGEFEEDPELVDYTNNVPQPTAVLSPYFHCSGPRVQEWAELIPKFAAATVGLGLDVPIHGVICGGHDLVVNAEIRENLVRGLLDSGCDGVSIWITGFDEYRASEDLLTGFRKLTEGLAQGVSVHNMHGGYFSLALSKHGMSSTAHGVGYGEQKDIVPIQGQAMPTVRYYLPPVRRRLGVANIERTFREMKIFNVEDFYREICDCVICRGIVKTHVDEFSAFGDARLASSSSRRKSQTPAAAKRCRFHFLINRFKEVAALGTASLQEIIEDLERSFTKWEQNGSVRDDLHHLKRWASVLK